jgi:hypothetical protein
MGEGSHGDVGQTRVETMQERRDVADASFVEKDASLFRQSAQSANRSLPYEEGLILIGWYVTWV